MVQSDLTKADVGILLDLHVSAGNTKKTQELLKNYPDLADLSDNEINEGGILFGIAIKKSPELVRVLIDGYVATKLQGDPFSLEYIAAKHKLKVMLEQQIDESPYELDELSPELQAILTPWMPESVDSEVDEQDLSGLDSLELEIYPILRKSHSEPDLAQYCHPKAPLLYSSSESLISALDLSDGDYDTASVGQESGLYSKIISE